MSEWLTAVEEMSRHRMQLLLVLPMERIKVVAGLLTEMVGLMQQILATRNLVWSQQASTQQLWEVQRSYVRVGYRLMMEIKNSITAEQHPSGILSAAEMDTLAQELTIPFEKASVVLAPYGSYQDYSWLAIWQIDSSPEWQKYFASVTHSSVEELDSRLRDITRLLYERSDVVQASLVRFSFEGLKILCLAVSMSGRQTLKNFLETDLVKLRESYKVLWSSCCPPLEIANSANDLLTPITEGKGAPAAAAT